MARRRAKDPDRDRHEAPVRHRRGGTPPPAELSEDADVVRAVYRALEAGDLETFSLLVDPDVGWIEPAVTRLPFDGTRRGLPSVLRAAFRRKEDGTDPHISAETFLELGDGVLVAGRFLSEGGEETFLHESLVRRGKIYLIRGYPAGIGS